MTVQDFIEKNQLQVITQGDLSKTVTGCYIGDLLSLAMSCVEAGQVWMTVQGNVNIAAVAALTEPACILLVEGRTADGDYEGALAAYEAACLLYEQSRCS